MKVCFILLYHLNAFDGRIEVANSMLNSMWKDCSRTRKWERYSIERDASLHTYVFIESCIHGFKTMYEIQSVIAYRFQFIIKYCFTHLFVCTNAVNVLLMYAPLHTCTHWNANYMQISILWCSVVLYAFRQFLVLYRITPIWMAHFSVDIVLAPAASIASAQCNRINNPKSKRLFRNLSYKIGNLFLCQKKERVKKKNRKKKERKKNGKCVCVRNKIGFLSTCIHHLHN